MNRWLLSSKSRNEKLIHLMEEELALRSRAASLGTIALATALSLADFYSTGGIRWLTFLSTVLLAGTCLVRFYLAKGYLSGGPVTKDRWRRWFPPTMLLSAAFWAFAISSIVVPRGFGHPVAQVALLFASGAAAGALVSLSAAPRLLAAFLSIMLLVPMGASIVFHPGRESFAIPFGFAAFVVYLLAQCRVYFKTLSRSFERQSQIEKDRNVLQTVLDTVPGYISCVNRERQYVAMNRALRRKLGLSESSLQGLNVGQIDGDAAWIKAFSAFIDSDREAAAYQTELEVDGEMRWHLLSFRRSPDENWIVWISLDVHQERMLQLETDANREKLLAKEKMSSLGEMAGGIAHEINNPLSIIVGKASQARRRFDSGDFDVAKMSIDLGKIEATALRIAKIIKGLRTFSRNAENDPPEPVNLKQLLEDALELCSQRFRANGIDLRVDLASAEDLWSTGRPTQLTQVILNVLNNAHDAVEPLEEKWVEVKAESSGQAVVFTITDSGRGIPEHVLAKIMQPFFSTKEVGKGTGLGLSISKGIIEEHGGKLVYDPTSRNTCFRIELPSRTAPPIVVSAIGA